MEEHGYRQVRVIGRGSFSNAYLCEDSKGRSVVCKELNMKGMNRLERESCINEVVVLRKLNHPNITKYLDHFYHSSCLYIVLENANAGDMNEMLRQRDSPMQESEVLHYLVQICLALKHIHEESIIHRDLKLQNIFLSHNGMMVKIGDFGLAKQVELCKTQCGTPFNFSPEICQSLPYDNKSDIWSLGCIVYEMCTLSKPFQAKDFKQLLSNISYSQPKCIGSAYSEDLRALLSSMLHKDPKKRPSAGQILKMEFIKTQMRRIISPHMPLPKECAAKQADQPAPPVPISKQADQPVLMPKVSDLSKPRDPLPLPSNAGKAPPHIKNPYSSEQRSLRQYEMLKPPTSVLTNPYTQKTSPSPPIPPPSFGMPPPVQPFRNPVMPLLPSRSPSPIPFASIPFSNPPAYMPTAMLPKAPVASRKLIDIINQERPELFIPHSKKLTLLELIEMESYQSNHSPSMRGSPSTKTPTPTAQRKSPTPTARSPPAASQRGTPSPRSSPPSAARNAAPHSVPEAIYARAEDAPPQYEEAITAKAPPPAMRVSPSPPHSLVLPTESSTILEEVCSTLVTREAAHTMRVDCDKGMWAANFMMVICSFVFSAVMISNGHELSSTMG